MKNISLLLSLAFLVPAFASAEVTALDALSAKVQMSGDFDTRAREINKKIEDLKSEQRRLEYQARAALRLSSAEVAIISNSAPTKFPEYCTLSLKAEGDQVVATINSTKENKTITTRAEEITLDRSSGHYVLSDYSGTLFLSFDEKGVLSQSNVSGKGGSVSCPYEEPFHCPACE